MPAADKCANCVREQLVRHRGGRTVYQWRLFVYWPFAIGSGHISCSNILVCLFFIIIIILRIGRIRRFGLVETQINTKTLRS